MKGQEKEKEEKVPVKMTGPHGPLWVKPLG